MQMRFMPGKGTIHVIFVRRIMKKYEAPGRKLLMVYVDLEKAFDRDPREIIRWAPRRKEVMERKSKVIMEMYKDIETADRKESIRSELFDVKVKGSSKFRVELSNFCSGNE